MMHFQNSITLMMAMKASLKIVLTLAALMCAASALAMTTVRVGRPGTLGSVLTREQQDTCTTLAIVGRLNSADIKVLRYMGQRRLTLLDLSQVQMVSSKEPYLVLDAAEEYLVCAAYVDKAQEINKGWRMETRTLKLGVVYVLNYQSDEKFIVAHTASFTYRNDFKGTNKEVSSVMDSKPKTLVSKDEFVFRKGLTDEQWKVLRRSGLNKFPGHRVQKDDGRYTLYCCTKKKVFSGDFFYKCPSVKVVILPKDIPLDESITEYGNPVKYMHKELVKVGAPADK